MIRAGFCDDSGQRLRLRGLWWLQTDSLPRIGERIYLDLGLYSVREIRWFPDYENFLRPLGYELRVPMDVLLFVKKV